MAAVRGAVGTVHHEEAVRRLVASYSSQGVGEPVRLAKSTSNLFRPRQVLRHGLDVSDLDGVIGVDAEARTADVQGMCTYEDLVAATLPYGLIPLVVPQLRTITLGGAVTGLGIESTSFRNGLPHESVLELDVLTGAGDLLTATADNEHAELFWSFPNSYGSLGYATRLRIELEAAPGFVELRHVRFSDAGELEAAISAITEDHAWQGQQVDGMDGVAFAPGEYYLTLARFTDTPGATSDYTGQQIYYRSIPERTNDRLSIEGYLWRWDTDWFWCSRPFGVQHPLLRRLWPRRWRRSDTYHRLVALDRRYGVLDRLDRRAGRPQRERVIQDVEVPVERLGEFLAWFDERVGMRPVWLCPLRLREDRGWPGYPLRPDHTYVNLGFWGTVPVGPEAENHPMNRAIEAQVTELGGHKSLYSESFYDPATFERLYDTGRLTRAKSRYDPEDRLPSLYDKAVAHR